jgi:hypothetical protein
MAATITPAPHVKRIAEQLIPQFHQHLENATILYLFTDAKRSKNKKVVLGTAKKTSPMEHFLSQRDDREGADFVLLFGVEEWFKLTEEQRTALVDHELMHCSVDYDEDTEEPSWAIRAHDVEEFAEIIRRHGLSEPQLEEFAAAMEQLRLPIEVPV